MKLHSSLRSRVERLLGGDFQANDLTMLFLAVREHCDGRNSVKEIGDFAAHQGQKNKGIVTREVRDFFTIIRFQHSLDLAKNPLSMPANAADYFEAAFRRIDSKILREDTGMLRGEAQSIVPSLISKLHRNPDGTLGFTKDHTPKEIDLGQCLLCRIVVRPAFTAKRLFDDFEATLRSNGLLQPDERRAFVHLFVPITLYAVSLMHKSSILQGDGANVSLAAGMQWNEINVQSHVPMPRDPRVNGTIFIASNIFATELDPRIHCELEMLPPLHEMNQPWPFDIEVNTNRKLARIR